jgi:hypothetical protein
MNFVKEVGKEIHNSVDEKKKWYMKEASIQ